MGAPIIQVNSRRFGCLFVCFALGRRAFKKFETIRSAFGSGPNANAFSLSASRFRQFPRLRAKPNVQNFGRKLSRRGYRLSVALLCVAFQDDCIECDGRRRRRDDLSF